MRLTRFAVSIATLTVFVPLAMSQSAAAADLTPDGGYACPPLTEVPAVEGRFVAGQWVPEHDGGTVLIPTQNLAHVTCERAEAFIYAQNRQAEVPSPGLVLSATVVLVVGVAAFIVGHIRGANGH